MRKAYYMGYRHCLVTDDSEGIETVSLVDLNDVPRKKLSFFERTIWFILALMIISVSFAGFYFYVWEGL